MVRQSRGPFGSSGETAKRRLKLLLVSDKAGCSPEMIRLIREDMIHAISKYMDIDKERVQLLMDTGTEGRPDRERAGVGVLHANIPVRSITSKGLF